MTTRNRAAFDAAVERWNAGDLDGYLELYDDSITLHGYGDEPMDKAAVRGFYQDIWRALSDIELQIHEVVEDEAHLSCRFTMLGTHTGELAGVPATGRRVAQPGMTILSFASGRCVERWSVADFLSVLVQLGATTLPG